MNKIISSSNNWKLSWICAIVVSIVFIFGIYLGVEIVSQSYNYWDGSVIINLFRGLLIGFLVGMTLGLLTRRQVLERSIRAMLGFSLAFSLDVIYLYDHQMLLFGIIFFISLLILWTDVFKIKNLYLLFIPPIIGWMNFVLREAGVPMWLIPLNPVYTIIMFGTAAIGFIAGRLEVNREICSNS